MIEERQGMAETRKSTNGATEQTVETGRETVDAAAGVVQEAAVVGLDGIRRTADQFTRALGLTGQESEAVTCQASENIGVLAESGAVLVRGMQDVSFEWLTLSQNRFRKNIDALTQLARCRSLPDFVAVQSELMRDHWQQMIEGSRRIAERSLEVANEAAQKISAEAKQAADRTRKAA
jgi:hypothetical protein